MQSHERAAQILALLTYAASSRQTVTYEILGSHIGVPHWGLSQLLEPIQSYCLINRLPALTSIVVKQSGYPGDGFIAAQDVPAEQQRVFTHAWTDGHVPSPEELQQAAVDRPSCGLPNAANP